MTAEKIIPSIVVSLFTAFSVSAQDTLKLKSGSLKRVQIININDETVHFKPTPESPNSFYFAKTDIEEIWFQNGKKEKIISNNPSLEELKAKAIDLLSANAYLGKSKNPIQAAFESNFLILSDNSQKAKTYDLSKVFSFQPLSFRGENLAFINIVLNTKNSGSESWAKEKLVLHTENHEKAVLIQATFKKINAFLIEKKEALNEK